MMYLILSQASVDYARAMSAALYRLSAHPTSSGTAYAVPWRTSPVTGQVALCLSGDQYLQPGADIAAFVDLLPITADEASGLTATLEAARGQRLTYADMLPQSLRDGLVAYFGPININTASADELPSLPGVGPVIAQAIIDGRDWADPADLSVIDGISADMVAGWQADPGLVV